MDRRKIDLRKARILVTNDDGIHAPGLKALERIARTLTRDVWVVAPETEQSATSHSLTLRRPLRPRRLGPRRFAVDGTPTDCVLVARHDLLTGRPPDMVLSGINHGGNLGEDVTYSGTIAAAMEGAILGIRAVAFSQVRDGDKKLAWTTALRFAPDILRRLAAIRWTKDMLVNVNFPACSPDKVRGVHACRQGRRTQGTSISRGVDPGGHPYIWVGNFRSDASTGRNTDLSVVEAGGIAVTPLHLDLTHKKTLRDLSEVFT